MGDRLVGCCGSKYVVIVRPPPARGNQTPTTTRIGAAGEELSHHDQKE